MAPLTTQSLDGPWQLSWRDGPADTPDTVRDVVLEAVVPGQVHTTLLTAGVVLDPDVGTREHDQAWVGRSSWTYRRTVVVPAAPQSGSRVDLVAQGLDTVARVSVNGRLVGATADQHLEHRWDVTALLAPGDNEIEVELDSPWEAAQARERRVGALPTPYPAPYPHLRKEASNFGWDWGPRYLTAGIWRSIRLETWSDRLVAVLPRVGLSDAHAGAVVDVGVEVAHVTGGVRPGRVVATLTDPDGRPVATGESSYGVAGATQALELRLVVDDPRLWWPVGEGEQPLYDLLVELHGRQPDGDEQLLDRRRCRLGLRSVALDERPDEQGRRWGLVVNGRALRVRGYNWIPDDPIASSVTPEAISARLDDALEGGATLLRVWGGGHFAEEALLDGCDERGLLVWHDFLFACAAYDESDEVLELVEQEARQAITRMAPHPSLVVWCGGNECIWGAADWQWQDVLGERPWGERIYTRLLPAVMAQLRPGSVYVPNSPWSGPGAHPNDEAQGPTHLWEQWNARDYTSYREHDPAFVSEMGWCAPPSRSTLRRAVEHGELDPGNPEVVHHMRAADGMAKLARGLQPHLPTPSSPSAWLVATQLTQARAQSVGTQWLRSRERCAGVVVWQLNDCWPSLSWAAVDVDGVRKPLWYALRESFAPRLLTLQPRVPGPTHDPTGDAGLELVAVNDGRDRWTDTATVRRLDRHGSMLAETVVALDVAAGAIGRIPLGEQAAATEPADEVLVADHAGGRASWWFRPDRVSTLQPWRPTVRLVDRGDHLEVGLTSDVVARDVLLLVDQVADDLRVTPRLAGTDRALVTLLPGETLTLRVTGLGPLAAHDLDTDVAAAVRSALWSANDLLHPAPPGGVRG